MEFAFRKNKNNNNMEFAQLAFGASLLILYYCLCLHYDGLKKHHPELHFVYGWFEPMP